MKRVKIFITLILAATLIPGCLPDTFDDPNNDPRDNFIGDWRVNERSQLYGETTYDVAIKYDINNSAQVEIVNFYGLGNDISVKALPTQSTITIFSQYVCNHTIKGEGFLTKNEIDWTYTVNDGADVDSVAATFLRL